MYLFSIPLHEFVNAPDSNCGLYDTVRTQQEHIWADETTSIHHFFTFSSLRAKVHS